MCSQNWNYFVIFAQLLIVWYVVMKPYHRILESINKTRTSEINMPNERITIKDIAEKAGVSVGTVDRVLHKRPNVSKKALSLVTKALEDMNIKVYIRLEIHLIYMIHHLQKAYIFYVSDNF